MSLKIVREPSEIANITNTDDFVGLKYAYGGQSGYVRNYGDECDYVVNGSDFIIKSGLCVEQGVEVKIDANGYTFTVDNVGTTRYYALFLRVNLATQQATIVSKYSTAYAPNIYDYTDDLTANPIGISDLLLYNFTARNGVITDVKKLVRAVKFTYEIEVDNAITAKNAPNVALTENSYKIANTRFVNNFVGTEFLKRRQRIRDGIVINQRANNDPYIFNKVKFYATINITGVAFQKIINDECSFFIKIKNPLKYSYENITHDIYRDPTCAPFVTQEIDLYNCNTTNQFGLYADFTNIIGTNAGSRYIYYITNLITVIESNEQHILLGVNTGENREPVTYFGLDAFVR